MSACREWEEKLTGYLDKELTPAETDRVEAHLAVCPDCRREYESQKTLLEVTDEMKFIKPPDELWEHYWDHIYNRLERRIGWIFLSIGAVILAAYGLYALIATVLPDFWGDPDIPTAVKIGTIALAAGVAVLLVSIVRERLFAMKSDRYREVKR